METVKITTQDDVLEANSAKLSKLENSLTEWRFRIVSALLVASSATLALSLHQPPSESNTPCIVRFLMISAGVLNSLHILACVIVFGILLKHRKAMLSTFEQELQQQRESGVCQEVLLRLKIEGPMKKVYQICEKASFLLFAIVTLLLGLCRVFLS